MALAVPGMLADLLEQQSGVISRSQAISLGLAPSVIDARLRTQRWMSLHRGVYATFTGAPDRQARLWAVVLRAGPKAALSYWTAAELHGLTKQRAGLIHVTVPPGERKIAIRGAAVHHSRLLDAARHPAQSPPRTRVEDTVLDLTQVSASRDEAFNWISLAVGNRMTTAGRLLAAQEARPRLRWRRDLLVALGDVAGGTRSVLERRYITGVERAHGLPAARRDAMIRTGGARRYADNLYDDAQLAVELDGREAHPPEQRQADNRRDRTLAKSGIQTVRYSWADVADRPCAVAAEVAALLNLRGMPVQPRRCGPDCAING